MFGFDEIIAPLHELPEADRTALADFIAVRDDYRLAQLRVSKLKSNLLRTNNPAEQERISSEIDILTSTIVAPAREAHSRALRSFMQHCVNTQGLKEMFPMLLAGVLHSVNLPLLLEAIGFDGDNVKDLSAILKDVLK